MAALDCFIKATEAAPQLAIGHMAKAQSYADIGLADDALIIFANSKLGKFLASM